jgi:hypothetical protein
MNQKVNKKVVSITKKNDCKRNITKENNSSILDDYHLDYYPSLPMNDR